MDEIDLIVSQAALFIAFIERQEEMKVLLANIKGMIH
jgi:hypothetical protein